MEIMDQIQDLALALGSSPWLLLIVFAVTVIDGVFPPVPSETIVISAAALSAAGDGPHLALLVLVAAAGALWAGCTALAGIGANSLVSDNPLLAVLVGIVGGLLLGLLIEAVLRRLGHAPAVSGETPSAAGPGSAPGSLRAAPVDSRTPPRRPGRLPRA